MTALAVVSLYFLHLGFKRPLLLPIAGWHRGGTLPCGSIPGKQYVLVLVLFAPLYTLFYWRTLKRSAIWSSVALIVYGFLAGAMPILCYIVFNREAYTYYEGTFIHQFWDAMQGIPPNDMRFYVTGLWNCFFAAQYWPRLLFPDFLPIPLPYYWFLVPGFVLAVWEKRFEVVLLATLPVAGVFVTGGLPLSSGCCLQSHSGSS